MVAVSLFHPYGAFDELCEAVLCAEEAGFDGVLFGEHHGTPGNDRPQLLVLLAALAARTERIRLGSSIILSPLYDPVHLAEMAAMVDVISKGRLILGLGLGYQPNDFDHFSVPFKQRVSRFEEGIAVLRRAWTEDRFSFSGKRYSYENVGVYPKPMQQPTPPIWLAAWSLPGARRAGRLGDAYVTDPIQNLTAISDFAGAYRESAAEAGRLSDIVIMREFLCAPSRQEAIDRYGPGLLAQYRYYWTNDAFMTEYEPWASSVSGPSDLTFEMVAENRVIYGTPDDCVGQLEHWVKTLDASHVQLAIPYHPGGGQQGQLDAIRYTGEQVVPRLQAV